TDADAALQLRLWRQYVDASSERRGSGTLVCAAEPPRDAFRRVQRIRCGVPAGAGRVPVRTPAALSADDRGCAHSRTVCVRATTGSGVMELPFPRVAARRDCARPGAERARVADGVGVCAGELQ